MNGTDVREHREVVDDDDDGGRGAGDDGADAGDPPIAHDAGIVRADEEVADGAVTAGRAQAVPATGASPDAGSQ